MIKEPEILEGKRDASPALSNVSDIKKRLQIKPDFDSSPLISKATPVKPIVLPAKSPVRMFNKSPAPLSGSRASNYKMQGSS